MLVGVESVNGTVTGGVHLPSTNLWCNLFTTVLPFVRNAFWAQTLQCNCPLYNFLHLIRSTFFEKSENIWLTSYLIMCGCTVFLGDRPKFENFVQKLNWQKTDFIDSNLRKKWNVTALIWRGSNFCVFSALLIRLD